ncbi:hypothetical protein [Shewanella sp. GutDb-MelDb]|uniref:hypothetical protein n=1 Tax=Shewanella sp. GutDb-MelDb TaxID=2058316 RepID=UPI0011AE5151|nr:hypothetical protein [Shewanella sp. GutDb-MelDb]
MTIEDRVNRVAEHLIQTYTVERSMPGYRLLAADLEIDLDIKEKVCREILIILECYSLIDIKSNNTVLISDCMRTEARALEVRFNNKLNRDDDLQKLVGLVNTSRKVDSKKIPSEKNLAELLGWSKQKVREKSLWLQYCGYVECKSRVGKFLIKKLP